MADSMPCMDWLSPNIGETFQLFKQKANLYFSIKKISGENQVNHILLAVRDEGLNADYEKELLSKDEEYSLEDAFKLGRTYEASASHIKQLQQIGIPQMVHVIRT